MLFDHEPFNRMLELLIKADRNTEANAAIRVMSNVDVARTIYCQAFGESDIRPELVLRIAESLQDEYLRLTTCDGCGCDR